MNRIEIAFYSCLCFLVYLDLIDSIYSLTLGNLQLVSDAEVLYRFVEKRIVNKFYKEKIHYVFESKWYICRQFGTIIFLLIDYVNILYHIK